MTKLILTMDEITKLRQAATYSMVDCPYRPLLLEMALVGLSRWAIAGLLVSSFKQGEMGLIGGKPKKIRYAIQWQERHNVIRNTRLSEGQWNLAQEYLLWRQKNVYVGSSCLFVAVPPGGQYWQPMKPERVRSEIRSIGRDCYVSEKLEIPDLHRAMANAMRMQGISEDSISDFYSKKSYDLSNKKSDASK